MWTLKAQLAAAIAISISLAGSAWWLHSRGVQSGQAQVQALWDAEAAQRMQAQAEELARAAATAATLQARVTQLQRSHRNEISAISRAHAAALDGLRDRPEARADTPSVPADPAAGAGVAAGCTGAGLSGPDARFLAGEAAIAAELQAALRACKRAYAAVVEAAEPD